MPQITIMINQKKKKKKKKKKKSNPANRLRENAEGGFLRCDNNNDTRIISHCWGKKKKKKKKTNPLILLV